MAVIRKLIITMAFCMFCVLANAQNNKPKVLDQLVEQCRQVIALNDTINVRQARLNELTGFLNELMFNWLQTCNEALSSAACDDNTTRLNTLNNLIQLTDPEFEKDILSQLKDAINDPSIRTLKPIGLSTPGRGYSTSQRNTPGNEPFPRREQDKILAPKAGDGAEVPQKDRKGDMDKEVTPVTDEQPKDAQGERKDDSSVSPEFMDSKKEPEKQIPTEKKKDAGNRDKTKIEGSKDRSNRNKTIELMNNKNKNK